jgi:glyoxylase-like metal-dependent hydrolase (beta-lactamase superfamily II)
VPIERYHEIRILKLESRHLPVFLYSLNGLLIDTGFSRQQAQVLAFVKEEKPSHAALTHHHEDHSGNVASVMAMGVHVWAPRQGVAPVAEGFPVEWFRRRIWGRPEHARCEELPAELRAGSLEVRAVHAPGHSDDMTVLHVPERGWLFTGDLFIARRLKALRDDEDPNALIRSLNRVLELDFDTVFCAHRGVVTGGREQLRVKRDFLVGVRDQVRELAGQGWNARQITRKLFGREQALYYTTMGKFAAIHFAEKFLATDQDTTKSNRR